uniref:Transmembrane protein n=1 Tax=Gouania willdenowi TaxID=441366 RepID=A0A8C5FY96_GOUWI
DGSRNIQSRDESFEEDSGRSKGNPYLSWRICGFLSFSVALSRTYVMCCDVFLPQVAGVMSTRVYLYLSSHPFAALSLLIFSALAAVPFGVFFSLALIITTVSVLSFVFFEGFLLVFGVLTLLFVLSGIAFFSVFATLVLGTFYVTGSSISSRLFLRRNKVRQVTKHSNNWSDTFHFFVFNEKNPEVD